MNNIAIWNFMMMAKFTYIVYVLCIINITLALGLFLIARFA